MNSVCVFNASERAMHTFTHVHGEFVLVTINTLRPLDLRFAYDTCEHWIENSALVFDYSRHCSATSGPRTKFKSAEAPEEALKWILDCMLCCTGRRIISSERRRMFCPLSVSQPIHLVSAFITRAWKSEVVSLRIKKRTNTSQNFISLMKSAEFYVNYVCVQKLKHARRNDTERQR